MKKLALVLSLALAFGVATVNAQVKQEVKKPAATTHAAAATTTPSSNVHQAAPATTHAATPATTPAKTGKPAKKPVAAIKK